MSTDKTEFTLDYSILKVPAEGGKNHTILITTSLKTSTFVIQETDHQVVTLDILATYLDGPITPDKFTSGLISRMGGKVDTLNKSVKLTKGSVEVVPCMQGFGVGTFLFNQVVCWAKKHDPQLQVVPIKVAYTDATEDNQIRRNKFYASFSIYFSDSPTNEGVVDAHSIPMRIADLTPHQSQKNKMQEQSVEQTLRQMCEEQYELEKQIRELTQSLQGKDRVIAQRDRSKARVVRTFLIIIGVLCLALLWRW
ncbi:hypothetical protein [Pseudomonas sp. NPDC089569]|uniref:hypothetical protein n=1 Tax=Pseudomonas sp. NPDC089569 TaxID=3390722 RepID=UPI003D00A74A